MKVALVAPGGTDTAAGTSIDVELLERETLTPAAGDTSFSVTVPVELAPPRTEFGESVNSVRV